MSEPVRSGRRTPPRPPGCDQPRGPPRDDPRGGHVRTSTSSPIPCAPAAMRGLGRGRVVSEPVRLLDERRYDPPRHVEVELNGQWWPGLQHAWRLTSDRDYWVADVEVAAVHDWGRGKHFHCVPPGRVRRAAAESADQPTGR